MTDINDYSKADFRIQRERLGLTQTELARRAKVTSDLVKKWENPNYRRMPNEQAWNLMDHMCQERENKVDQLINYGLDLDHAGQRGLYRSTPGSRT